MCSKSVAAVLAVAVVAGVLPGWGCSLNRQDAKPGSLLGRVGGGPAAAQPKRCLVKIWVLPASWRDEVVNGAVWGTADEQAVSADVRRQLEANGLRMGVLTGGLPAPVEAALKAPAPHRIEPTTFDLPDGFNTLVSLAESTPSVSLILNRDGRALGKDYKEASGFLRLTAAHEGPTGVALRVVPEIHHGPTLRRYDNLPPGGGNYNTLQFTQKDGQQEDTLRELAASVTLEPGQILAIGHDPDRKGSLGSFLLTRAEAKSDRLVQKLVLMEVSRTHAGTPGSQPKVPDDLRPVEPFEASDAARPGGEKAAEGAPRPAADETP